jgi:hypothetical protein
VKPKLEQLEVQISNATGEDDALDRMVADTLRGGDKTRRNYTASIDDCVELIETVLPEWHWHIGRGPRGILPYATLQRSAGASKEPQNHVEATAPTVPLALLLAVVKAARQN